MLNLNTSYHFILKIKRNNLTALLITYNEIHNIDAAIATVSFVDEIVVVDSFSTDGTLEAVQKYKNVKLIQHKFINFSDQRNFALQQASNDWVLFIDADERISKDLQREISEAVNNVQAIIAYAFYRKFYFKKSPLKFSGYQTNKAFRLFNKNFVKYSKDKFVHETLNVNGKTTYLSHKLDHYSYINEENYKAKLISYAQLRAKEMYLKKVKPNFYHFYIKPAYRFLSHYIIRLGFLDGKNGYKISKLNAFEVQQRYVELRKLYTKS